MSNAGPSQPPLPLLLPYQQVKINETMKGKVVGGGIMPPSPQNSTPISEVGPSQPPLPPLLLSQQVKMIEMMKGKVVVGGIMPPSPQNSTPISQAGPSQPPLSPLPPSQQGKIYMTAIRGCRGAERAKDADGYLYTKRRLINAKYGIKIEWECVQKRRQKVMCPGKLITSQDLTILKTTAHCQMCIKYSDEKISAKELEEDLIMKSCIAGKKVGPVFLKIKKELYKVGLLAYGTIKTKLKDRIRNRMAKIQGKKNPALSLIQGCTEQYW